MNNDKVDWSKVKSPAFPAKGRFYSVEPEKPKNEAGWYHWKDILLLEMQYDEDGDGVMAVTLKDGAAPSESASGMMWMWLNVSARGCAVKHPDATNQEHREYIDEFNEFLEKETLRATRKERQVITDHLVIREVLVAMIPDDERFYQLKTHLVNPLTAKLIDRTTLRVTAVTPTGGLVRRTVCGQFPFVGKPLITARQDAVRKVCEERSGKLV